MIVQVRSSRPELVMDGADYFNKLAPYFLRMEYTDSCDGEKADDLCIDLADRDRKFIDAWMPEPGANLEAAIICERWFAPFGATLRLDCGKFWIDAVDFELPEHTVSIKASSVPVDSHIKTSNEIRGWEQISFKDLVSQIAKENHLEPVYPDNLVNPRFDAVEQVEESSLQFLRKRALDLKLGIKVSKGQLIVFDELQLEQQSPAFTLIYGNEQAGSVQGIAGAVAGAVGGLSGAAAGGHAPVTYRMSGGRFHLQLLDTTRMCEISAADVDDGSTVSQQFDAGNQLPDEWKDHFNWNTDWLWEGIPGVAPPGKVAPGDLESFESDDSGAGALLKAKSRTREKNKHMHTGVIEMSIGNPLIAAGQTFTLQGCGQFDGQWFIEQAKHSIHGKYTTQLSVRMCLEGY